ncbi:MAG: hypothetical protein WCO23_03860 [bacterium]
MKKSVGIFSLTSCEGCEFEMLNHYEKFNELLRYFDIKNFRLGQEDSWPGPFDIAIVEGNPEGEEQIKLIKHVRKISGTVVIIGACAHLGGIQSERNRLPRKFIDKDPIKTVSDYIKVDYIIPGCPIRHEELFAALMDIYWGKIFTLPDLPVCAECRQNENVCHLRNHKPCLGPITRGGCNSICINKGEACLGCRGTINQPNIAKLKEALGSMITEDEVENLLTFYGDYEKEHNKFVIK